MRAQRPSWPARHAAAQPDASLAFTIGSANGAFGHVKVRADGTVTFLSGKLPAGPFTGTGGTLTMGASGYPSLTIDATAGGGGATLKVSGTLTTKGSLVEETGFVTLNC